MKRPSTAFIAAVGLAMLAGCATTPTVDDGRQLDRRLLLEMEAYAEAAAALRPAIVRAAALNDTNCSTQYELPFDVLTTYGAANDDAKVAWMRTLGVDETLSVIAAVASSGLQAGDIVAQVAGNTSGNALNMAEALVEARDRGEPFTLGLASGEQLTISPFKVCRGHVQIASPLEPAAQGYHWTQSVHPLEIFHQPLTTDEALWIVLWTQGLSERAGARMKTHAFLVGGVKWIAVLGLGVAASGATASARGAAAAAGTSSAGQVAAVQLAGQAASLMAQSAANRASLSGINGIAADMFDRADQWAFDSMLKLGRNPRAGLSLHEKLIAHGAAANAFLFDEKRLARMRALVAALPDQARTRRTSSLR